MASLSSQWVAAETRRPILPSERDASPRPASPQLAAKTGAVARLTTFNLNHDAKTSFHGFGDVADKADQIFSENILPLAANQKGFVHLQRFFDHHSGEFKILSHWETEEDCQASAAADEFYAFGLQKLRPCARYGMFKTEEFKVWKLHQRDAESSMATPYARTSVLNLNEDDPDAQKRADDLFKQAISEAEGKPGFVGAERLLGNGDAAGTYMIISYWESHATLRASSRGTEYYERYLGKSSDQADCDLRGGAMVSANCLLGFRQCAKPGTDLITQEFQNFHYDTPGIAVPFMAPGGSLAATFQLACISFGVGVFVMPSILAQLGLVLGCCLLAMFALFSDLGMQMMLHLADTTGQSSYEDVVEHSFGYGGRCVALLALAISTFTANCAHMQFVSTMFVELNGPGGGLIETLVGPNDTVQRFASMVIFGGLALPLCFKRQLSELRFVSVGVVVFCICATAVVAANCLALILQDGAQNTTELWTPTSLGTMLDTTPVVAFGFSSVAELFHVRAEIKRPQDLSRCAHIATAIVVCVYLAVALVGALAFHSPQSNVLESFPGNHLVAVFRMGIVVMVTLLYPIINFPTVQALDALIVGKLGAASTRRWRVLSAGGLAGVLVVNMVVTDLDAVFGLAGALGLGLIAYVLPSASLLASAYRRVYASTSFGHDLESPAPTVGDAPLPMSERLLLMAAVVVLLVGLCMTFGSTIWIIRGVVETGH